MASAEPPGARRLRTGARVDGDRPPRQPPTFGPEPAVEIAGRVWCWWDLWIAAVVVLDHHDDLGALTDETVAKIGALYDGRRAERLWSHLGDLGERLVAAGLSIDQLVTAERLADKRFVTRARDKLAGRGDDGRALTSPMRSTPREQLTERLRYGGWVDWPLSPQRYYELLGGGGQEFVSKGRSSSAAARLERALAALAKTARTPAEQLGLGRAFHTVAWELADRADDSYGTIGQLRADAFADYSRLDPAAAGMDPQRWWQDLAGLVVADNYALTTHTQTDHWQQLPTDLTDPIETWLRALADEYRACHARYESQCAIDEIVWLTIAHRRWRRVDTVVAELGPDSHYVRRHLATALDADGHPDLAGRV